MREGLESCLELTRASAEVHLCDCGVVWRRKVLGDWSQRAGARAFCGEERDVGWVGL